MTEDRAAALTVFEQHRERLRSELRMAPSAATRALADEIRGGERAAAVMENPSVESAAAVLVGRDRELLERDAELQVLEDLLARAER